MSDDIIARLLTKLRAEQAWLGNHEDAMDDPFQESQRLHFECISVIESQAASIARLRRLLHKYGDRIPLATNARPDWQQEIDEAFEWVANNPERSDGWTEKGRAWLDAGAPLGANYEWWEREGLTEPCPNWREGTRRCNCKACRARRKAAA